MPVDALLGDYFRARRYIGAKDRGVVAELVYFILRHGGTLEWHIEQAERTVNARRVVITALLLAKGDDARAGRRPVHRREIRAGRRSTSRRCRSSPAARGGSSTIRACRRRRGSTSRTGWKAASGTPSAPTSRRR
ncbi:MAG: hypothetical protein WDN72_01485 [Alphaproteobacteria bacterium]